MVLKNMEIFPLSLHSQRNGSRASYPSDLRPFQPSRRWKTDQPLTLYRLIFIAAWLNANRIARSGWRLGRGRRLILATERELDFMNIDAAPRNTK